MTCDHATPSAARHVTPAARYTASSSQSFGQSMPKNSLPATVMIPTCSTVLVTALAAIPPK